MELVMYILNILLVFVSVTLCQNQTVIQAQVLSTFIYTRYGDRTPFAVPRLPVLTPLGAQQLYKAGSKIRDRYVEPDYDGSNGAPTTIRRISQYLLDNDEITVLAADKQYITASAQAFMQGLYPALDTSYNYSLIPGLSDLANGTNIISPLGGVQYANIRTLSANDLNSIYVAGADNCPAYTAANAGYYRSTEFQVLQNNTRDFYNSLRSEFLDGYFPAASVGYFDAYYIWDYLNYATIHNSTVADNLDITDLTKARALAADYVFALNANVSASGTTGSGNIANIAGRTLASRILRSFYKTINSQGELEKMTLLFGSFEPMIALAALLDLVDPEHAGFFNIPEPGSSFIFELFALRENDIGTYPTPDQLFVRFLYQQTVDDAEPIEYPLFNHGAGVGYVPLSDFITSLERVMIFNTQDWCNTCGSFSVFCPAFTMTDGVYDPSRRSGSHKGKLSSAVAGVIGAVVALVVAGLLFAALVFVFGFRVHKVDRKRRSELRGFKGAEKLASDQDLTIPKGSAGAVVTSPEDAVLRGHERVGSWELKDGTKTQRPNMGAHLRSPSYEDDELNVNQYSSPVKPHDHV